MGGRTAYYHTLDKDCSTGRAVEGPQGRITPPDVPNRIISIQGKFTAIQFHQTSQLPSHHHVWLLGLGELQEFPASCRGCVTNHSSIIHSSKFSSHSSIIHPSFIHHSSIIHKPSIHLSSIIHPSIIHSYIIHPSFIHNPSIFHRSSIHNSSILD
jgi:hypothetical protein